MRSLKSYDSYNADAGFNKRTVFVVDGQGIISRSSQ